MAAVEEGSDQNTVLNSPILESFESKDGDPHRSNSSFSDQFSRLWRNVVDDNYLTLFGFRRYRTIHLLNLRFLEAEIDKVDHAIYQAGLSLDYLPILDRLGLKGAKRDADATKEDVDEPLILRLRELLKQYDEALMALNHVMTMETFTLSDNASRSGTRDDLNPYKTRLVRVDLPPRSGSRDPIQHYLRKLLRISWYSARSKIGSESERDEESQTKPPAPNAMRARMERSYQNTARVAEAATRFLVALLAGSFLVVPLVILSFQDSKENHLLTVSICIVVFSLLVSLTSKASNYETMAASAAYAAVLSVFVSGST